MAELEGPDLIDLKRHPGTGWIDLPDDGTRFMPIRFLFNTADNSFYLWKITITSLRRASFQRSASDLTVL